MTLEQNQCQQLCSAARGTALEWGWRASRHKEGELSITRAEILFQRKTAAKIIQLLPIAQGNLFLLNIKSSPISSPRN